MTEAEYEELVEDIERILSACTREESLCVLLTVTINAIHVIEDDALRPKVEVGYMKALRFLSAVEEQYQTPCQDDPLDEAKTFISAMMRHVAFRAKYLTGATPDEPDHGQSKEPALITPIRKPENR